MRIQMVERMLKDLVAAQGWSGPADRSKDIFDQMRERVSRKTLGALIGEVLGKSVVLKGSAPPTNEQEGDAESSSDEFSVQFRILVGSAEKYERMCCELNEFLVLRNRLVHHLLEDHDPFTLEGCQVACVNLEAAYCQVDRQFAVIREIMQFMDSSRRLLGEMMQSKEVSDHLGAGRSVEIVLTIPPQTWAPTLREAAAQLEIGGWTEVAAAADWIKKRYPGIEPKYFGCKRWRQVVQKSGGFELRRINLQGRPLLSYRPKPNTP